MERYYMKKSFLPLQLRRRSRVRDVMEEATDILKGSKFVLKITGKYQAEERHLSHA